MKRGIYRKPGESGAEPYLSSQFMGLFGWRAFIAGGDPISMGFRPVPLWRSRAKENTMTAKTSFRGSFTALVTPFKNGALDEKAFRDLVDWQIAEGTNGLVPVGTSPLVPSAICQSTRSRNAFSSSAPFLNGVTSAVNDPRKLVLAVMVFSLARLLHRGTGRNPIDIGSPPAMKALQPNRTMNWLDK